MRSACITRVYSVKSHWSFHLLRYNDDRNTNSYKPLAASLVMHKPTQKKRFFDTYDKTTLFVVLLLLLLVSQQAHSQQSNAGDPGIRIGILHSRKGTMSISEESLVHAALLAVEEINSVGGILGKKVIPIVSDGESDPKVFELRARELITQQKVCSIFGCWTSDSRKAVIPVVEETANLLWYPVQYEGGESSKRVIYTGAAPNQQIIPAVEWCFEKIRKNPPFPSYKSIKVFLVGSDYIFPTEANRIIKEKIRELGAKVVGEEYRPRGDQRFEEITEMIKIEKPDLIINTVNGDSNIAFFEDLAETWPTGISPPMIMSLSIGEDEISAMGTRFRLTDGSRFLIGNFCAWNYFQSLDTSANRAFVKNFQAYCQKNNVPGGSGHVTDDPIEAAYFQIHLFAKAVEKAGSTLPEDIRLASLGLEFDAPNGLVRIDPENQHTWKTVRIGQVRDDGQFDIQTNSPTPIRPDPYPKLAFPDGDIGAKKRKSELKFLSEIGGISGRNLKMLAEGLQSTYSEVRVFSAKKLGLLGVPESDVIQLLTDAMNDEDLLVSQTSLESIAAVGCNTSDAIDKLILLLDDERVGVRNRSLTILANLSEHQKEKNDTRFLPQLRKILTSTKSKTFPDASIQHIEQNVKTLTNIQNSARFKTLVNVLFGNVWAWIAISYIALVLFFLIVGLNLFPIWLLNANNSLMSATEIKIADYTIPIPIKYILGIGWFHYHTKVLDAWVSEHLPAAKSNFGNHETVKRRKEYVPVPVSLDDLVIDKISASEFQPICSSKRWCIHIRGQGGTGKTSLACQLAQWAMDDLTENRLSKTHLMIPILVEPGLGMNTVKDNTSLESTVLGQLALIVAAGERITIEFCRELMRQQRLMVILDDLALLSDSSWNLPSEADFQCNALVVTSRTHEKLGNARRTVVEPLTVKGDKISSFLGAYLQKRGFKNQFDDAEFFQVCKKMSEIVGGKTKSIDSRDENGQGEMTVLFVTIFAEHLIGSKRDGIARELPRDIPNLMLEYLDELNRSYSEFEARDVQRCAKAIAWHCCERDLRPGIADRSVLINLLGPNSERMINHLQNNLIIIQSTNADHTGIRFTIDPLSEYLACFHLISKNGSDLDKWQKFFQSRPADKWKTGECAAFLRTLRDCCLAHGYTNVDIEIPGAISKLLGEEAKLSFIKVGILHSLSGHMSISELPLKDAAELAIQEINSRGGVLGRQIIAIVEDGKSDPNVFAVKARQLIEDHNVCSIFGCWTTSSRKMVLPIVQATNNLLWYPVQYEGFESSPNIIYTGAAPNQQIVPAIEWCLREKGSRIFLVGSDYEFPRKANEIVKEMLRKIDQTPVGEAYVPLDNKDFARVVAEIKETKPDIVFNTVNGEGNRSLFTELRNAGLNSLDCPVMSVSLAEVEVFEIGPTLMQGHYSAWNYFQSVDTTQNKQFVSSYKELKGSHKPTDDPIEASYFQVHMFALALAAAKKANPSDIREAARGLSFMAPGGEVTIDVNNLHTWKMARIGQVRSDGQFDIVWTSNEPIEPDPYLKALFQ
jgi:urea transport system substrate-binding protein